MIKNVPKEKEDFAFYTGNWLINERELVGLQVSDHIWKKPGREKITPELIQRLVKKLEVEGPFIPEGRKDDKEFFKLEPAWDDDGKSYKLVWYLKDNDNHLWIKTCHRTKKKYKNNHEKK